MICHPMSCHVVMRDAADDGLWALIACERCGALFWSLYSKAV